jgi:hypothetical protein
MATEQDNAATIDELIDDDFTRVRSIIRARPGVRMEYASFGPLGSAAYARQPYAVFRRLKQAAILSPHLRSRSRCRRCWSPSWRSLSSSKPCCCRSTTPRLLEEIKNWPPASLPEELAIQWGTAVEFSILEGVWHTFRGSSSQACGPITDLLRRIGNSVPEPIELGYHLCSGDAGHQHFIEPKDAGLLVEVANIVLDGLRQPVSWVHLPVPRAGDDAAYSAPLATLRLLRALPRPHPLHRWCRWGAAPHRRRRALRPARVRRSSRVRAWAA